MEEVPVSPEIDVPEIPPPPPEVKQSRSHKLIYISAGIFILLLAVISVYFYYKNAAKNILLTQNPTGSQAEPYKINFDFAKYSITNTSFKPAVPAYTISIPEITNLTNFEQTSKTKFSTDQKKALTDTNFFITPVNDLHYNSDPESLSGRQDDWTSLYANLEGGDILTRAPQNSVFVTSDFLLHVYHRLLEKEFANMENKSFYPALKEITDKVLAQSIQNYSLTSDSDNKASLARVIGFFAVPKAILDSAYPELSANSTADQKLDTDENILKNLDDLKPTIPDPSYQKAKAELDLILGQKAVTASPMFTDYLSQVGIQFSQDYTQFTPRSHYTKNSVLRSYFRAMMWYGRNNFALTSPELTRDAVNISLMMKATGELKNWEDIYVPTAFLVGKSDDLGIYDYNTDLEKIGGSAVSSATVSRLQADMKSYQGPQIQSSVLSGNGVMDNTKDELLQKTKGFRFMGQRFTPDAFIFTSLTQGDEKPDPVTGQSLPSSTTALMVMSVLGNKTADPLVQNWISLNASGSDKVLNNNLSNLKNSFAGITDDVWTQNIYWGWLYNLKSLYTGDLDKTGYPAFMKNEDWNTKSLQAALGSWTELKHDTLLYAKQSYAEKGGGGGDQTPPPVPKGYVEPNITFLDRLIALNTMTENGLESRGLIDQVFIGRNKNFLKTLSFFRDISVKELQNETISDDDFETLRTAAGYLSNVLDALPGEELSEKDGRSALIADVQTDAVKGQILYEADGIPDYIYVAVKDVNGTRLTKGLVYNYYEFEAPLDKRLTDQDWWKLNYTPDKSQLPAPPDWSKSLVK
jgi:hypothetical protein